MTFSKRLAVEMERAAKSIPALAREVSCSPAAVYGWLGGERFPRYLTLLAIARALKCDPAALMGAERRPPRRAA